MSDANTPTIDPAPAPAVPATPEPTGDNPEKFAGKYDTPDALAGATHELRGKLGLSDLSGKPLFGEGGIYADVTAAEAGYKDLNALLSSRQSTPEPTPQQADPNTPQIDPSDPFAAVQQELAGKGIDDAFQKSVSETWAKDGKLTDEQYQALQEKGGYSKAVVNAHMAALASHASAAVAQQQTQVDSAIDKASQSVGGDEQLQSLLGWAKTHYSEAEVADLNRRLADTTLLQGAVDQIASAHKTAVGAGNTQQLITNTQTAPGPAPITTPQEFKDMQAKAQAGDKQAQAALLKLDDNTFAALATRSQ